MKSRPTPSPRVRRHSGFTLVEVMVSMTIVGIVFTLALVTFTNGLRAMYKDGQRLATNTSLRYFISQVSAETLDATEFYVFPTYESLDGSVNLTSDVSALNQDGYGTYLAHGDCLLLVRRVSTDDTTSNIRKFCIYYRVRKASAAASSQTPIRYYEKEYDATGTATSLTALLNAVDLKTTPSFTGSRQIIANARGRPISSPNNTAPYNKINGVTETSYPIFATESPTSVATNTSVSVNVEIINGTTAANQLSSSSFNYTISPRK